MSSLIAYCLVVPLVQFCFTIGTYLVGFPVALLLAWSPTPLRTKVAGFMGGVGAVAFAIAFGYGVFRFVVGPDSFTIGAFLASTVPLLLPIRNDFHHSREVKVAQQQMYETFKESRGDDAARAVVREIGVSPGSDVTGAIAGLVLAIVWFFSR